MALETTAVGQVSDADTDSVLLTRYRNRQAAISQAGITHGFKYDEIAKFLKIRPETRPDGHIDFSLDGAMTTVRPDHNTLDRTLSLYPAARRLRYADGPTVVWLGSVVSAGVHAGGVSVTSLDGYTKATFDIYSDRRVSFQTLTAPLDRKDPEFPRSPDYYPEEVVTGYTMPEGVDMAMSGNSIAIANELDADLESISPDRDRFWVNHNIAENPGILELDRKNKTLHYRYGQIWIAMGNVVNITSIGENTVYACSYGPRQTHELQIYPNADFLFHGADFARPPKTSR